MALVKISDSLLSKCLKASQDLEMAINKFDVSSYMDLKGHIRELDDDLYDNIFDVELGIKRNIFIVYNNAIIGRNKIKEMEFQKDGVIEIMLQFGGG